MSHKSHQYSIKLNRKVGGITVLFYVHFNKNKIWNDIICQGIKQIFEPKKRKPKKNITVTDEGLKVNLMEDYAGVGWRPLSLA